MPLDRRDFCALLGAGLPASMIGSEAGREPSQPPDTPIRLDSNENPYGPSAAARAAFSRALADGGRYPSGQALTAAIATAVGGAESNVLVTVGATEALGICAQTYTSPTAPLVTAAPTYAAIATATEALGHPVIRVPIAPDGGLDLERMAERARGAGAVYLCNPNNPTGVLRPATAIGGFIERVTAASRETVVVIGEAYHEYLDDPGYRSAVLEAINHPRVLVTRTFSKLYGLAGVRLGYLVGHADTIRRVAARRVPLGANGPGMAAALAALADEPERLRQRRLNRAGREEAERFFRERGWRFHSAAANYLFIDVKREITAFRALCQARGLLIGRYYPPADTWARLTIGSPAEMRRAYPILDAVLGRA
ncbi:MAG: pyridoxal phosphate-dependent aminotransferase [Gemmatimonadales bacterium]